MSVYGSWIRDRRPFASSNPQWVIDRARHVGVSEEHLEVMRRDQRDYAGQLIAMGYRPEDVRHSYVHRIGGKDGGTFAIEVTIAGYVRPRPPLTR